MKNLILLTAIVACFVFSYGQGLVNKGAIIKVGSGAYLKTTGVSGNVTNEVNGLNIGKIDINGTLVVGGNLNLKPGSWFTIQGLTDVSGNVTVFSDATGSGSLIDYGTLSVSGTSVAQIFTPLSSRYYYVSTPVSGATAGSFGSIATTDFLYSRNTSGSEWNRITNPISVLQSLTGYATRQDANDQTISLTGTFNTGLQTASIVNTGDRWNLIGNPFPSALDYGSDNDPVSGWTRTNIRNTVYVKHGAVFATWNTADNGTGLNDGSRFIPAMQSFWVKSEGVGALAMNNDVRTHNTSSLLKTDPSCYQLRLALSGNGITDEAIVRFHSESDDNLDKYDSEKFLSTETFVPQIYSYLNEEKMAINTFVEIPERKEVDLGVSTAVNGQFKLRFTELESFPPTTVIYLRDKLLNKYVNLWQTSEYVFDSKNIKDVNRFSLLFSNGTIHFDPTIEKPGFTVVDENGQRIEVSIYSDKNILFVQTSSPLNAYIQVYNIVGNKYRSEKYEGTSQKYEMNVATGHYIVKLIATKGVISKKIYLE